MKMRNDALMNGGLIGFGVGFIGAGLALHRVVSTVVPEYATLWYFNGIIIIGAVGLAAGVTIEIFQRIRARKRGEVESESEDEEVEEID